MLGGVFDEGGRRTVRRSQMVFAALQFEDVGKFCLAQAAGCFHDGVEDWLKLDCGRVDGVQDIAGSFLPLERFGSRLSLEISFFPSTSASAGFPFVGALRAVAGFRTDFLRFAIEMRSGPGKLK
jgi:hypothetical protein